MTVDTDRFNNSRDETLLKRRPWYVLAVILLFLSAITRQPIAFLAALFAFVIGFVPEIWYRTALRHLVGERATPRRLLEDPLRTADVREYVAGDDPRRIHWKATARAGELRSKIYEPSSQYRLLILLDINTYLEPWMGLDLEIQELTIATAASIAMWALDEGYTVGLLANSLMMVLAGENVSTDDEQAPKLQSVNTISATQAFVHRARIPMASDSGQREQLLSALGRLLPYFGSPMDALIEAERFTLPLGTTVVLVSTAGVLRATTIENLVDLRTHGAAVCIALTA